MPSTLMLVKWAVLSFFVFFFNKLMIENEDIQTYLAFEPPHHRRGEMML